MCTSNRVSLDGEDYDLINCEVFRHETDIIFITFYISEDDQILGGVTVKKQFEEYLEIETRGFQLDRWTFSSVA